MPNEATASLNWIFRDIAEWLDTTNTKKPLLNVKRFLAQKACCKISESPLAIPGHKKICTTNARLSTLILVLLHSSSILLWDQIIFACALSRIKTRRSRNLIQCQKRQLLCMRYMCFCIAPGFSGILNINIQYDFMHTKSGTRPWFQSQLSRSGRMPDAGKEICVPFSRINITALGGF